MEARGGWSEYQRLVLHRLDDLEQGQAKLEEKLDAAIMVMQIEIATRKVWSGLIGSIAGAVLGVAAAIVTTVVT